ncbi:MAG TPA: L,D-transpeptidase [Gemmatimonadaceae bacterium]|jgi:lipoprotein-anchoring transpeptidase ErfK/SrfK|nr:L,D-transpeptidase [Gemmatimonadaceae bacterium]
MKWMRRSLLALAPMISATMLWLHYGGSGAADPPMRLEVSLSARELRIVEHGDVVQTYGVAVGRPGHPTPTGSYTTGEIEWNPRWTPPPTDWARNKLPQEPGAASNPMQAVKIYFKAPYYFIHGTNDPGSIGEAASHGCIRMTPDDATALAHRIEEAGGHVSLVITD